MLHTLSWDSFILPPAAAQWRRDVERASGLPVQLLRDDAMSGAEGEAWSEPGLRAVALAANDTDGGGDDVMTIVHELGHLKLETLGWPHCYLCAEDMAWIEQHYALISDLVSLVEHQSFFPAMMRMGLDPYAASEADLVDADVLDELRCRPAGLIPDHEITMQLLRALLEASPEAAERVMRAADHLIVETRLARRLAAIVRAAPCTPAGFRAAMRDCWAALDLPAATLCFEGDDALKTEPSREPVHAEAGYAAPVLEQVAAQRV